VSVVDAIRSQAARRPAHAALRLDDGAGGGETVSYAELLKSAEGHASRLRADGVAPGDRCGLAAPQGRHFVELALGILAADACLVPIPDDPRGPLFEAFAARAHLHHALLHGPGGAALRSFADVRPADGSGDSAFRALRPAYLRFTSGTTSRRKGVALGREAVAARLAAANRGLGIGPDDRVLWLLPMAHHFLVSILLYLQNGATVLLPASSLARPILEFAAREGTSVLYASPHHYRLLASDDSGTLLRGVRMAISTADGLRRDVADAFRDRFGLPVAQALGIIEVGLPVANLEACAEKPEALGRPLPDYRVWLRGEDGRPLAGSGSPERPGEICIRGPGMLDAYLQPWTPAREILEPDGFRSGDQGWFDADGCLYLVGRRANRISMAGMKFFAEEVEEVLDRHPDVRESRVLPRDHPHLGQVPVAEIVPADPARAPGREELARHCREYLARYKVPREFRVVDALPHTPSGKLRRR
jgi:long-chain acyl-CoA synthetase